MVIEQLLPTLTGTEGENVIVPNYFKYMIDSMTRKRPRNHEMDTSEFGNKLKFKYCRKFNYNIHNFFHNFFTVGSKTTAIFDDSRIKRIARGSGRKPKDLIELLRYFNQLVGSADMLQHFVKKPKTLKDLVKKPRAAQD